ncbi:monooxygenase [Burkholderia stagnalis]|uniref:FAD-dependent monooxygenase n=1 Tax=Burkholderia stagnalis TaxID=1503054 RepID=A0A6L3MNA4_9BURK|nr:FAD-dependent monooxygenase [Burkholderia stagnalis]KAB0633138.1 FAD-dependent monooxygenase [Burkholderia stagnalis]KVO50584.1 monooxygenase [Burkholderia stagnalis]KVO69257.1 monooxygenase [Burkholderia stagnalis]KVW66130.1 monooxygenase [Burkholderia stagnalis]KVW82568.1 monooxygenase [Burkholderia stagnalis]
MQSIHVAIVGAGLGGLCLAQALKRAGIAFDVYERDPALDSRRQGFRIRIDATGQRALAASLPAGLYALFRAAASRRTAGTRFLTPRLTPAAGRVPAGWQADPPASEPEDPADLSLDRLTLREILMAGIEHHIHFGHAIDHYRTLPDGRVQARFTHGGIVDCDVLVGADGVNSAIRSQLAPAAAPDDTGSLCVYGKTRLQPGDEAMLRGGTSVVFADGCTAVLEDMRFQAELPARAASTVPHCRLSQPDDYFYWALIGPRSRFGLDGPSAAAPRLPAALEPVVRHWHPALRRLLCDTPPSAVAAQPVRRGRPDVPLPAGPVTLLGDAIHAMSPAGGAGANTALKGAGALAALLAEHAESGESVRHAVARYAEQMRAWATDAVAASERAAALLFSR